MHDEVLDELKVIRETLERLFELVSLQAGAEVKAPAEMHFHVQDVSTAMRNWKKHQQKDPWNLF